MRLLLDECLPRRLKTALPDHEVRTVTEMGWSGIKNDQLFALADQQFDGFVTVDRGLPHQRPRDTRWTMVVVPRARSNRLAELLPLVPALLRGLAVHRPGEVVEIGPAQ
jgi:uncharacterized protein DUF5615